MLCTTRRNFLLTPPDRQARVDAMTTTPTPEWTAGCSCGWRGMSEDAETHACAWDEVEEVRDHVNWDLRMAMEAADAVRNAEAVGGPARPAEEVIKAVQAARGYLDRAERDAVKELRLRRFSWSEVGHIFGISRQAAQQRFGGAK